MHVQIQDLAPIAEHIFVKDVILILLMYFVYLSYFDNVIHKMKHNNNTPVTLATNFP